MSIMLFEPPPWLCVSFWLSMGYIMIIFNKMVLTSWNFGFPLFLTAWHSLFATIVTQILARFSLLDGVSENKLSRNDFLYKFVPMGFFFASGLCLGNTAYKYLSISYIQMLKSFTPVPTLLASYLIGKENPSTTQLVLVIIVSLGVAFASIGESYFSIVGFLCQILAMFSDVSRMTIMDSFLSSSGQKFDVLSLLYYMAPLSFVFLFLGFLVLELPFFNFDLLTPTFMGLLFLNAMIAFLLNVSVILVISRTSAVTMSLAGLLKDILLVVSSILFFHSILTSLQLVGYSISLVGLHFNKEYRSNPLYFHEVIKFWKLVLYDSMRNGSFGKENEPNARVDDEEGRIKDLSDERDNLLGDEVRNDFCVTESEINSDTFLLDNNERGCKEDSFLEISTEE